jgi:hypothetical protein
MKKHYFYFLAAILLSGVIIWSCDKNSTDTGSDDKISQPSMSEKSVIVNIPENLKTTTDPYASMCYSYINLINSLTSYNSYFYAPENATKEKNGNKVVYSYSNGKENVWYEIDETATKNTWTVYYSDASNSISKSKVIYYEETKDGKEGKCEYYDYANTKEVTMKYWWTTSANGTLTFNYLDNQNTNYVLNSNPDGSGDLKVYSDSKLIYEVTWDKDGHGNYKFISDDSYITGQF